MEIQVHPPPALFCKVGHLGELNQTLHYSFIEIVRNYKNTDVEWYTVAAVVGNWFAKSLNDSWTHSD